MKYHIKHVAIYLALGIFIFSSAPSFSENIDIIDAASEPISIETIAEDTSMPAQLNAAVENSSTVAIESTQTVAAPSATISDVMEAVKDSTEK